MEILKPKLGIIIGLNIRSFLNELTLGTLSDTGTSVASFRCIKTTEQALEIELQTRNQHLKKTAGLVWKVIALKFIN